MRPFSHLFVLSLILLAVGARSPPPLQSDSVASLHPLLTHTPIFSANLPRAPLDRLPRHVIPTHYVIRHHPPLGEPDDDGVYSAPGHVTITIATLVGGHNSVTLHLNSTLVPIDEDGVRITKTQDSSDLGPLRHDYEPDKDFYTITLATPGLTFQAGAEYKLEIPFITRTSGEPFGLWVALAPDPAQPGVAVRISATILEPNFARRVLPCFDEPDLKATVDVVIGRDGAHQSLAHTPIKETIEDGAIFWDYFETTPVMSIYLLCLVVAPSHYAPTLDDQNGYPAPVASWGPRHLMDRNGGLRSARTTAKSLTYFQSTYATPYALSKLDSIVIPGFPAGALENWGINTYVDARLLHFEDETPEIERGRSISTQHHEVSHQWFGNLVTCRWWDDIWLNEGLANYQSFKGVLATNPEFDPVTLFVSDSVQVAMRADQNPASTHPVHFATLPDNWMGIFDTLSYSKGGSLIRMLEGVLGQELLDDGLRHFLTTWKFKGADQDDLFGSIDAAVAEAEADNPDLVLLPPGASIKSLMQGWTLQSGYPLVRVSRASVNRVFISQQRFSSQVASFWDIPINIVRKSDSNNRATVAMASPPDLWLTSTTSLTSYAERINTTEWLLLNPDAFGYYRVLYDDHLFNLLLQQLESDPMVISPGSRSQLFDDYWNLELAGYVELETALQLTRYLRMEDHLVVWTPVFLHLRPFYTRLSGTPGFVALQSYLLPRIEAALDRDELGWTQRPLPDLGNEVVLRANLLDWACGFGAQKCTDEAERLFSAYQQQPDQIYTIIAVDLQPTLLCAAVASEALGSVAHAFLVAQYRNPPGGVVDPALRLRQVSALACTGNEQLLSSTLTAAMDPSLIDIAHRLTLIQRVAENPAGRGLAFEAGMREVVGGGISSSDFEKLVSTLAGYWHLESDESALQAFVNAHEELLRPVRTLLDSHLARIRANVIWMEEKGKAAVTWMIGENMKA